MRLLNAGHVDGDDVLLAAVQRLGEREGCLGLADAGRPESRNTPIGLFGSSNRARLVSMRFAIIDRRCDPPMTRLFNTSDRLRTVSISSFTMRPRECPSNPIQRRRCTVRQHGRKSYGARAQSRLGLAT